MKLNHIHSFLAKNQVQEAAKALSLLIATKENLPPEFFNLANQVIQKDLEVIHSKTRATH